MKILELIIEGYKEAQSEFQQVASPEQVKKTIDQFRDLVNRNQIKGSERNIDYWRKQGWQQFAATVEKLSATPSKTQSKRSKVVGNSINLLENGDWLIVIPLDKEASCFHGKNTDWCTAKPTQAYFEKYFYTHEVTLIYVINKKSGEKWAIASHPKVEQLELFNKEDTSISEEDFKNQTGFVAQELVKLAIEKHQPQIIASRSGYKERMNRIRDLYNNHKFQRSSELEQLLTYTKHPEYSLYYIRDNGTGEYPEPIVLAAVSEDAIAVRYVTNISDSMMRKFLKLDDARIFYFVKRDVPVDVQTALVKNYPYNIQYLQNPDESVQMTAIKLDPDVFDSIRNLSPAVELEAIKLKPQLISKSYYQSPQAQMAAVLQEPLIIRYIRNPTPEVQVAAYKNADEVDKTEVFVAVKDKSPELIVAHRAEAWDIYIQSMIDVIKNKLATGQPVPEITASAGSTSSMQAFLDKANNAEHKVSTSVQFWVKKINKFFNWWNNALEKSQAA